MSSIQLNVLQFPKKGKRMLKIESFCIHLHLDSNTTENDTQETTAPHP